MRLKILSQQVRKLYSFRLQFSLNRVHIFHSEVRTATPRTRNDFRLKNGEAMNKQIRKAFLGLTTLAMAVLAVPAHAQEISKGETADVYLRRQLGHPARAMGRDG